MGKIKYFCVIFIAAGFLACCNKDSSNTPTIDSLKLLWSVPLQEQTDIYKFVEITDDVIYNNGIVVGNYANGQRNLKMIDLINKETKWVWEEKIELAFSIHRMYQYRENLIVIEGKNLYCIDLNTGKTKFYFNKGIYFDKWVAGLGSSFFIGTNDYSNGLEADLYKGNIQTGEIKKYLTPDYEREFPAKNPLDRTIYKIKPTVYQGDTLLFLPYIEPNPPYDIFPKMGLYNMTKSKWLYQNKRVVEPATGYNTMPNGARIIGDRIYLASGHDMICFELLTGKEIWRRNDFTHEFPFAFHGFEIFDNKLIATSEEQKTYCIDVNTGKNIWVLEKMGGTNSFIRYHNGILYYLAGGLLRCVDIETGSILKSMPPPDDSSWQWRVVVAPQANGEKAKIVAFTHKNMYIYEAIR